MSELKENTDRELWREREGDYYADSIHVTAGGAIGINCGGHVIVRTLQEWHRIARAIDREGVKLNLLAGSDEPDSTGMPHPCGDEELEAEKQS